MSHQNAVACTPGSLLILAPPGSGKTHTLLARTAWLLKGPALDPTAIILLTFTRHAAGELRSRLSQLLGVSGAHVGLPWTGTLHAWAYRLLRQYPDLTGLPADFRVCDRARSLWHLARATRFSWSGARGKDIETALDRITTAKAALRDLPAALEREPRLGELYARYQERLAQRHELDLADLVRYAQRLLSEYPEVRAALHLRHVLVDEGQDLDRSQLELLARLATPPSELTEAPEFTVVADPNQAIYGWRGGSPDHVYSLMERLPSHRVHYLHTNFRATEVLIEAAGAVIQKADEPAYPRVQGVRGRGERIELFHASNSAEEAVAICRWLQDRHAAGMRWSELAVLSRRREGLRAIECRLLEERLPYRVVFPGLAHGPGSGDLLAYLRVLASLDEASRGEAMPGEVPKLDRAWERIAGCPPRGIRRQDWLKVVEYAVEQRKGIFEVLGDAGSLDMSIPVRLALRRLHGRLASYQLQRLKCRPLPLRGLLSKLWRETGLMAWYDLAGCWHSQDSYGTAEENRRVLLDHLAMQFEGTTYADLRPWLAAFDQISGVVDGRDDDQFSSAGPFTRDLPDAGDPAPDPACSQDVPAQPTVAEAVHLLTIHAAKGAEFAGVCVANCTDGLLPGKRPLHSRPHPADLDLALSEERRLFYVAITRARERLLLTSGGHPRSRPKRPNPHGVSQFVRELPPELLNETAFRVDP